MTGLDYLVMLATLLGIAAYGAWTTRGSRNLESYLHGSHALKWGTIGLSVMATQASAITFLSMPGMGYETGMGFVQNYFGMPLALIIVCAVFLPIYRRLNVFTAYEYLENRFDGKTRLLGALLFLLQRGLAAGITLYAPAIILSLTLGWPFDITVVACGLVVITYTVTGGTRAVSVTQRYQMTVILIGMGIAFYILIAKLPSGVGMLEATRLAGSLGKLETVSFSLDITERYTIWTGLLGGLFLSLSYFGADQSQVQRYLGGSSLTASRFGLLFNAVVKIPMQFLVLFLGALLFVFYLFEKPPVFFNQPAWETARSGEMGSAFEDLERRHEAIFEAKRSAALAYTDAMDSAARSAAAEILAARHGEMNALREETRETLLLADPGAETKDSDFIFITFVVNHLPTGLIGLLLAVVLCAAMSSTASELNALASTTTIDFYQKFRRGSLSEHHKVRVSKILTVFWGSLAIAFAIFARLAENLIEAINILGSIFYGVILGIFLTAFFLKFVRGTPIFLAALIVQPGVVAMYFTLDIGYLWFNAIGCLAVMAVAILLQLALPNGDQPEDAATAATSKE